MESDEDKTATSRRRRRRSVEPQPDKRPAEEIDDTVKRILRGLYPEAAGLDPVLARAGPKLKAFRERSGWTAAEICERTGVPLEVLEAFEAGQPMAEDVLVPALDSLTSACCCTVEDLGLDRFELGRRTPVRRDRWTRPDPLW